MGLLDKLIKEGSPLSVNSGVTNDLTTQYTSQWLSGTPTTNANPGPVTNFVQDYSPNTQYANTINVNNSPLQSTFPITNLDVENPKIAGGPIKDTTTQYPSSVSGTPTSNGPGKPLTFSQFYIPKNKYLSNNPINVSGSGKLDDTLKVTNLDAQDKYKDPTVYPATVTSTPTSVGIPGSAQSFKQPYNPNPTDQYLNAVSLYKSPISNSIQLSGLDAEGPGTYDDPTVYPATVTGTPTNIANPGGPTQNFSQSYTPTNTYLTKNPIQTPGSGKLNNTLSITNLDVENKGVSGGPNADIVTQYPSTVTGTPTNTKNPGGPITKFTQPYTPSNTYLNNVNNGELVNTSDITNLDVEDPSVQGGPNKDTTTNYGYAPETTGTPTSKGPGSPINFSPSYYPGNKYLSNNPIAFPGSGELDNTLNITNLDVENKGVIGGIPYKPKNDPTVYPDLTTGTPTSTANPGGPAQKFNQIYTPVNTYLNDIKNNGGELDNTLNITNLDVEDPGVIGGIPYKPENDPTIYPTTTNGSSFIRGYFSKEGKPQATKYGTPDKDKIYEAFSPTNTYVNYIENILQQRI